MNQKVNADSVSYELGVLMTMAVRDENSALGESVNALLLSLSSLVDYDCLVHGITGELFDALDLPEPAEYNAKIKEVVGEFLDVETNNPLRAAIKQAKKEEVHDETWVEARISSLLDEITDYVYVDLEWNEIREIGKAFDEFLDYDCDDFESGINRYLSKHGYTYNGDECVWEK